jgi:hypothetical protein
MFLEMAYDHPEHCQARATLLSKCLHRDIQGMVVKVDKHKTILVSFRGTVAVQFKNWLVNFQTEMKNVTGMGLVHEGFLKAFSGIWGDLQEEITKQLTENPDYSLTLVGHSLGGAMATIAAVAVKLPEGYSPKNVSVITYGSPRVGNQEFVDKFNSLGYQSFRVVHDTDFVVQVPSSSQGYVHVPTEFWIFNGTIYKCPGSENPDCSSQLGGLFSVPNVLVAHRAYSKPGTVNVRTQ